MKKIISASDMRQVEDYSIREMLTPEIVLMERAAEGVFNEVCRRFTPLDTKIIILCGTGKNGGDGMAVARLLSDYGYKVSVAVSDVTKLDGIVRKQYEQLLFYSISEIKTDEITVSYLNEYDLILDGLLGIGINREISGIYAKWIQAMNESKAKVIAIDIPSGIDSNNGCKQGLCVNADVTVSFGFSKIGNVLQDGYLCCGQLIVWDIGLKTAMKRVEAINPTIKRNCLLALEDDDLYTWIPSRTPIGNKGTFGKVLLVAGSKEICGAAMLSARSAFATGCGMVKVITHEANRESILNNIPEAMLGLYEDENYDKMHLANDMKWCNMIAVGPGLSQSKMAVTILEEVIKNSEKSIVIDADAINILSENSELLAILINRVKNNEIKCVITPHMKEFARFTKALNLDCNCKALELCKTIYQKYGIITVCKDYRTIVCGENQYVNLSGNDGMATAGSGDVLTGVISAFIAMGKSCEEAAVVGTYIHGKAGDLAAEEYSKYSMNASTIIEMIPNVFKNITEKR